MRLVRLGKLSHVSKMRNEFTTPSYLACTSDISTAGFRLYNPK